MNRNSAGPPGGMTPDDEALGRLLRERLRATEQLDFVTASKLRAARARALAQAPISRSRRWLPAAAAVAATLLAVLLVPWNAGPPQRQPAAGFARTEMLDVLLDDNEPEFYEDLDLYLWLEQDPANA